MDHKVTLAKLEDVEVRGPALSCLKVSLLAGNKEYKLETNLVFPE